MNIMEAVVWKNRETYLCKKYTKVDKQMKDNSSTKVELTSSSPFFANAMLVAGVSRYRFGRPL